MKKTISSIMLAGTVLSGLAVPAFSVSADTQTITGQNSASVTLKGNLGKFDPGNTDPTDPNAPGPGNDWIKVSLPTVLQYSSGSNDKFVGGTGSVTNYSPYPVSYQVTKFTGADGKSSPDITHLVNLNIDNFVISTGVDDGTTDLVKDSKLVDPSSLKPIVLGGSGPNRQDHTGRAGQEMLAVGGTLEKGTSSAKQVIQNNTLTFTLTGLDADGHVPA